MLNKYRCPKCGGTACIGTTGVCPQRDFVAVMAGKCDAAMFFAECGECGYRGQNTHDSFSCLDEFIDDVSKGGVEVYRRIHFFNGWHNGDVHVSREFVKWIIKNVPAEEYVYSHKHSPKLIMDIPELSFDNIIPQQSTSDWVVDGDVLYINTWFRTIPRIYDEYECTIQCLYHMFRHGLDKIGVELTGDIESFIPQIDYDRYEIGAARLFLSEAEDKKKVFFCNGTVLSNQIANVDMNPIIVRLADKFDDVYFFLPNGNNEVEKPNVFYTKDIIKSKDSDLNENAYIAKFCDIIFGRASGPHAFCWNTDNVNKKVISISYDRKVGTFGLDELYPKNFIHTNNYDVAVSLIENEIEKL